MPPNVSAPSPSFPLTEEPPRAPPGLSPEQMTAVEMMFGEHDIARMTGPDPASPHYFELVFKFSGPAFKIFEANAAGNDAKRIKATEHLMRSTCCAGWWKGEAATDEASAKRLLGKVLDRLPRIPHADEAQAILKHLYGDVAPSLEKA